MKIAVFGSSGSVPGDGDYEDGIRLGAMLAAAGHVLATGGYGGLMEAVARGAQAGGGHTVGFVSASVFPSRPGANSHVREVVDSQTIAQRIHKLVDWADLCIALPGSIGTLAELVVAWNTAFVAPFSDSAVKPVVAVGGRWRRVVTYLADELETEDGFVSLVATVDEAVALVASLAAGRS